MSIPPADVLASALREDEPVPTALAPVVASMVPLADAIRNTLASIALIPVERSSLEERGQLVELRTEIERIAKDATTWVDAIDLSFRRAAEAMGGAREIPLDSGVVKVEPPRGEWKVDVDAMKRELAEYAKNGGALSQEEVDSIFETVVETKANGTRLNYFARNRGTEIAAIIERHRRLAPGNPMAAKVRYLRRADG